MIKPEDWAPADGLILEPNALTAAVASEGSVIVAAGPGAGKTELLAQRADYLLRTGLCSYPRRILAISFKVDAARNLHERVRERAGGKYAARFDSLTFHAFAKRIIDNYRPVLTDTHALNADYTVDDRITSLPKQISYDDMVPLALEILAKNPYALGGIRHTYSHVFLDEFQDATTEQYELLLAAFGESAALLTAVGDTKQRIMVFAGALDGIMETFATDFDALHLSLYQNRRSEPTLRRMQNRMILDMDPEAASPDEDLIGDAGDIEVLSFDTATEEAEHLAELIEGQLNAGLHVSEIAVLVRQQASLSAAELFDALDARGIPFRNDQISQNLAAEPAPALIYNFIQVLAGTREPVAYAELMRVASPPSMDEEQAERFDRQLKRRLETVHAALRDDPDLRPDVQFWRDETHAFLDLVSRPTLLALSPGYAQADRLQVLINEALDAFEEALTITNDPLDAVRRLTDTNAIRVLTIHKCKGLEFEHVIVLGVEHETFWNSPDEAQAEYFVAISRAKSRLTLTHAAFRAPPPGATWRWKQQRTAHGDFLDYAIDQ
jgi:superfamily I DNA/RNA helicase